VLQLIGINAAAPLAGEGRSADQEDPPMNYKTILVHLSDSRRAENLLGPAMQLAARHNAHLLGLHVYSSLPTPPEPVQSTAFDSIVACERKNSDVIAETFKRMTANQPFVAEWQLEKVPHVDLAPLVIERGRTADLIVTGQADPDWKLAPLLDFPERLALESGRPVLVVPYAGRFLRLGRRVVIAWKAGREAARAAFDALPLLQYAEAVHVLEVKERANAASTLGPDTSIAAALARHAIKPVVQTSIAADIKVGDEILSRLADLDADLLVMGAYGHSRFREWVFGGVTRHIARHMTVPTLFSH
jgi:nucleotide-binding universal stress UspA family protein